MDELRDVERLGVRLVADLQRRSAALDAKAVHEAAEELAAVETTRKYERDVRADELRLPQQRLLAVDLLRRDARAVGELQFDRRPILGDDELELDEVGAFARCRVHDHEGVARNIRGNPRDGSLGELAPDLLGLRVAHEDLRRNLVRRAAADRVVRGVLEHAHPRLREERLGPVASVQRLQRLGVAFKPPLGAPAGRFQIDSRGDDAREQVRPRSGAHLPVPVRQPFGRRAGEVVGERPHHRAVRDALRELTREGHVVRADHPEHRIAAKPGQEPLLEGAEVGGARDVEEVRRVPVTGGQVLGDDRRAVLPVPDETMKVDGRRHSSPHHRRRDPGEPEDLRHLGDVPEHVR